jgi:hypothetical protein
MMYFREEKLSQWGIENCPKWKLRHGSSDFNWSEPTVETEHLITVYWYSFSSWWNFIDSGTMHTSTLLS